jgi:hypothetical protein
MYHLTSNRSSYADVMASDTQEQGDFGSRKFEHLVASVAQKPTPAKIPGENTFTSALISALKGMVGEQPRGCLTTAELLNKISDVPYFPEGQPPMLFDRRGGVTAGRVVLQPIQKKGSFAVTTSKGIGREVATHARPCIEGLSKERATSADNSVEKPVSQETATTEAIVYTSSKELPRPNLPFRVNH